MKLKRKGKIHPLPPPPPAPASLRHAATTISEDSLSVPNLLPATILALAAVLSLQDREVLAYLINRSLKTTPESPINSSYSSVHDSKKLSVNGGDGTGIHHEPPVFDCDCFDCYTWFWYRWDSSPDRVLIHQAIEAFEEHLPSGEVQMKRSSNRRSKKKEKLPLQKLEKKTPVETEAMDLLFDEALPAEEKTVESGQKGFARKVLPNVLGVFNSRLWNFWGPIVRMFRN